MTRLTVPLRERLLAAWRRSDALLALVAPEALARAPLAGRPPFVYYLGHLPAFAWNQVCRSLLGESSPRPAFDDLFLREGAAPPERWPAPEDLADYAAAVREAVLAALHTVPERQLHREHVMARGARAFYAVLEHELMHHETLLAMLQVLEPEAKAGTTPAGVAPGAGAIPAPDVAATRRDVFIPAGRAVLGARPESLLFGQDHEAPQHAVDLPAFTIDSTPVTNGDFEDFVNAGGYADPSYWTPEGWRWQRARGVSHPHSWTPCDGALLCRTVSGAWPLQRVRDWPVSVAWAEAAAYARWRRARLPTEAEFHRAAYGTPDGALRRHPWGEAEPEARHGNFDLRHWRPTPVGSHPEGASAFGVHELVGNGWEWTATVFAPHPGYRPSLPEAPCRFRESFDGRHHVLLGASWATDADLLRRSFRHRSGAHDPFVFSKFRCVREA